MVFVKVAQLPNAQKVQPPAVVSKKKCSPQALTSWPTREVRGDDKTVNLEGPGLGCEWLQLAIRAAMVRRSVALAK